MKRNLTIQFLFILFSLIFCSLDEKIGSDWFRKCFEEKSERERCIEYDFMSSVIFLKKQENTASFSPICSDLNILGQCFMRDFGIERKLKGINELEFVIDQIKNINHDLFNVLSCYYKKDKFLQDDMMVNDVFLLKIFNEFSAEQVFKKHYKLVKKKTRKTLKTPLNISFFRELDRISVSFIYFEDDWAKKFNSKISCNRIFKLSNCELILRRFMRKKDIFLYENINYNQIEFQIVAIPYKDKNDYKFPHYMVYLIPSNYNTDLLKLWDSFYIFSNGNIKDLILSLTMEEIDLNIPTVNNLRTHFDLKDLFEDVFKYNTAENNCSKMVTFINIDENDTEMVDDIVKSSIFYDYCGKTPYVIADRPHISLIFDMQTERILFITKDTGIIVE